MLECKICGCKFNAVEERHYISRDNGKSGLAVAFGSEPEEKLYDTFDCPSCGCQIVVQERKRIYIPCCETGLEVIDVIEAFTFDLKGIEATDTGNIIKYACRWKQKNGIQDLEKIMWYTQHLIDHLRKLEKENENYEK